MAKEQIHGNILARQTGMDYSPTIHFKSVSSIRVKQKHSPIAINWKITRENIGYGEAPSSTYGLPPSIYLPGFLY